MGLRICIDARIQSGVVGGVEQVVLGAAAGFSALQDGDEEYVFLTLDNGDWLKPFISGNCRIAKVADASSTDSLKATIRQRLPLLRQLWHQYSPLLGRKSVPIVDGSRFIAAIQPDIVHFVIQTGFLTSVPSIFSPFDLQHLHLPENFTPRELYARNYLYRVFCTQATMIVAASRWGKDDLVEHLDIPPAKIQIVPVGNILDHYPQPTERDLADVRSKFVLPKRFLYFPAQTYPNKNHIGLLQALARLRDQGLEIPLVCSGRLGDFYPQIEKTVKSLHLEGQVRFLGFVSPLEVQCLYRLSMGLIFPSKFEGWGQPVVEAFFVGVPVACSNVTSLPEVAGDAALLFDPNSVDAIAEAVRRLWQDDALRQTLIARGHERAKLFTWERTARLFRAHYRRICARPLTQEDQALLSAPAFSQVQP